MSRLYFKDFDKEPIDLAVFLLGKIINMKYKSTWLKAMIIETEAYELTEKGSHSSLGFTNKRRALFMRPGTIYMYYARGRDSLNISAKGLGNAVLIKSCYPYHTKQPSDKKMLRIMQSLNPTLNGKIRPIHKLCSGQTLLCKSLGIKVKDWDQKQFHQGKFFIEDIGFMPKSIIQTKRLGIPKGRDEHLMYRFIIYDKVKYCTMNPLTKRTQYTQNQHYIQNNLY